MDILSKFCNTAAIKIKTAKNVKSEKEKVREKKHLR
jgi:hypothetical protein